MYMKSAAGLTWATDPCWMKSNDVTSVTECCSAVIGKRKLLFVFPAWHQWHLQLACSTEHQTGSWIHQHLDSFTFAIYWTILGYPCCKLMIFVSLAMMIYHFYKLLVTINLSLCHLWSVLSICYLFCVDHNTLLKRLHHTFGITDDALDWLQSYLPSLLSDMDSMIHQFPQSKLESHKVLLWDLYSSHYTFHH